MSRRNKERRYLEISGQDKMPERNKTQEIDPEKEVFSSVEENIEQAKQEIVEQSVTSESYTVEEQLEQPKDEEKESVQPQENTLPEPSKRGMLEPRHIKKRRIWFIALFTILIFVCIIACFVLFNKMNRNIYSRITLNGINIGGYTSSQLETFLKDRSKAIQEKSEIQITASEKKLMEILPQDIEFSINIEETMKQCFSFGRTKNIFRDNVDILITLLKGKEMVLVYQYNADKLETYLKNVDLTVPNRYVNDSYSVEEKKNVITIKRGVSGNAIYYDKVKNDIITLLSKGEECEYTLALEKITPTKLDVEKMHEEIKSDPKDAYIDKSSGTTKVVKEVYGYDFDPKKLQEFLDLPENDKESKELEFPLTVLEPKVKLADLDYNLYSEKLVGYTTYFDSTQKSRGNNLNISLNYLNGKVIMPGETFSYNKAIGEITKAKGYLPAATFKGGMVVQEIGGGVCQTSSTLYNVALLADLQIVERHQHGLPVGYVQPSRDATIYTGVLDFRFKNTRSYPIKIVTTYNSAGSMNISLYGIKEEKEYEVIIESNYLSTIPFKTTYQYDNTMLEGQSVVISNGVNGYVSQAYKTRKLNGTVVDRVFLSKDTYNPQNKIIKIGVKKPPEVNIYE